MVADLEDGSTLDLELTVDPDSGYVPTEAELAQAKSSGIPAYGTSFDFEGDETPVSLGYDRIRFTAPVFFGDTITVTYRVAEIDPVRRRSKSAIEVSNQNGEVVAVAEHILKWVPKS